MPSGERVVQERGAGLVEVRRAPRLGFAAPPLVRSGAVEDEDRARVLRGLRLRDGRVHVEAVDGRIWVSGDAVTRIRGEIDL